LPLTGVNGTSVGIPQLSQVTLTIWRLRPSDPPFPSRDVLRLSRQFLQRFGSFVNPRSA
jgi:hypothetical protein